jgi:hypothetical protein
MRCGQINGNMVTVMIIKPRSERERERKRKRKRI